MNFSKVEEDIRQELEDVFPSEVLEKFTQMETEKMANYLHENWLTFSHEMLTEIDIRNIKMDMENIHDILWSTHRTLVPLLCMVYAIKETNCNRIREFRFFNEMTKDINYLYDNVNKLKTVKLNQGIMNSCGICMTRVENLNENELNLLYKYKEEISEDSKIFLGLLVEMIKSTLYHLNFYAPKEVEREKYLYALFGEEIKYKKKTEGLIKTLAQLTTRIELLEKERLEHVESNKAFLKAILEKHHELQLHYRIEPETKMIKLGQEFKVRKQNMLAQIEEKNNEYQLFVENNVKNFQKLSDLKFKNETTCQNWIQKYDTEASARQIVLDELREQEANLNEEITTIKEKTVIQDEEYRVYMEAKREDIRIALKIRVLNRAATRIQHWWRKLWKKIVKKRKKAAKKAKRKHRKF